MKNVIIFGFYHHSLYLEFFGNKSFTGNTIVLGSLVLGLLNPMIFLMIVLSDKRVRRYKNATEHSE